MNAFTISTMTKSNKRNHKKTPHCNTHNSGSSQVYIHLNFFVFRIILQQKYKILSCFPPKHHGCADIKNEFVISIMTILKNKKRKNHKTLH